MLILKKKKIKPKIVALLIISSLVFTQYFHLIQWETEDNLENKYDIQSDLPEGSDVEPISITSDVQLAGAGFPGIGSSDNPFRIENLNISGGVTGDGIYIRDTTLYFVIRNCIISNTRNGITLYNVEGGTGKIDNNTIYGCKGTNTYHTGIGIYLYSTNSIQISNNVIYGNIGGTVNSWWSGLGFFLYYADNCLVKNNTIHTMRIGSSTENSASGMALFGADFNNITENHIYDNSNYGSAYGRSGNGIYIRQGNNNYITKNIIHGNVGSNYDYSGNGILIHEYGNTDSNEVINNTIYDNTAGNGQFSGNGIIVVGDVSIGGVSEGKIMDNFIFNNTGGTNWRSGNGIHLWETVDMVVTGNTIQNCSGAIGSGNGILTYYTESSVISDNIIDNTYGTSYYGGNGIIIIYKTHNTVTNNTISNTEAGGTAPSAGNGIHLINTDSNTVLMNSIMDSKGTNTYSGWGIYLEYDCDYNDISSNNVSFSNPADVKGISLTQDYDYNRIMFNDVGSAKISNIWRDPSGVCAGNEYVGNTANSIYVYNGNGNLIEDNTVQTITISLSISNVIVGNLNSTGDCPEFTYIQNDEYSNYFLKITSPEAGKIYQGCGGIELTYKYQYKGYEISWLKYKLAGIYDYCPRPEGLFYLPWKSDGSTTVQLWANDTNSAAYSYASKPVSFSFIKTGTPNLLNINGNEQLEIFEGSGDEFDQFIIENKNIIIPSGSPTGTAGILIQNTDAHIILRDCIIAGGVGYYGISLKNVANVIIENCSIIGIPSTYTSGDISDDSAPIERGIYLDSRCHNNTLYSNTVYRTSSSGIWVDGDFNYFYNNIVANAYGTGMNITGNNNIISNNDIATFGGPDFTNYYYNDGAAKNMLSGILVTNAGSDNLIEKNDIRLYPVVGISIDGTSCQHNVIVENQFTDCDTNLTDSGTETHFLKIFTPPDNAVYTGSTPLSAWGYYPGTEGFQNIENGLLPDNWTYFGTGSGNITEVIAEKTDLNAYQHKKVLYCYTGEGTNPEINVTRQFENNYTSGTCEFWVLKKGASDSSANFTFFSPTGALFTIMLENENFKFQDNTTKNDTELSFMDDWWYRLSIDFSDDGLYAGLGEHQYRFRIFNSSGEGLLFESPNANYSTNNNCSGFTITAQSGASSNSSIFFDAFGYSWHPGYQIGNNMAEGMLISQMKQTQYLEWKWVGYSMNGESVIPLPTFGDAIIPLPNSLGIQSLQLYANDSSDFQTTSPITHFTYNFDRKINIWSLYENGYLAAEFTNIKGGGLIKMDPATDLNVTITYSTEKSGSPTFTNASFYYKINQESWQGPFQFGSLSGTQTSSFILNADNYILGDTVDYYFGFQQYDGSGRFLQQYYWTQEGLRYFESDAETYAFHKKVSPVPYQLTLNYSVFYQAEREEEIESDVEGYTVTMTGLAPVAMADISVDFFNTTSSMIEFYAIFDDYVSGLNHKMDEETCTIFETGNSAITEQSGAMSPFILPDDLMLVNSVTNISIPTMLFESNIASLDNDLIFTGEIINYTYKGIKNDWFFGEQGLKEFEISTGDIFATIRYDAITGIMVYYYYKDLTENEVKEIYFGLSNNNQSYPINLKIEKREELDETTQDFVEVTLDGILYDPPGDHSFTQMSAGTSITTGWSLETQAGTDFQKEYQILFVGFGFETDEYHIDTSGSVHEFEMTHTYEESLTSSIDSENSLLIGPGGGDLYYGTGTYIFYYFYVNNYYFVVNESDPVNLRYNDIPVFKVGSRIEYKISPNTSFSVLGGYLDDLNMPELIEENIFEDNKIIAAESGYVQELQNSPYLWTPSSVFEFGYSSSTSSMKGFHSYMEYSNDTYFSWSQYVALSLGASFGIGAECSWALTANLFETSGKIATLNTWSRDFLDYTTVTNEEQILVHLEDDDGSPIGEHDQFKMRIFNDTRYNSIGFIIDSDATYTSRPHEQFTGDRRPPSVCEFFGIGEYLQDSVPLNVLAIDEEFNLDEENNIFKVEFYYDDDPVFGLDSIFIGVHGAPDKDEFDDPEEFQVIWDCSLLQGEYYIFANAWDYGTPLLNSYLSDPKLVHIDNEDPSVCRVMAYEPYTDAINLYAFAEDIETDIAYVEYWNGDPNVAGSVLLGWSDVSSDSFNYLWATDPEGSDDGWCSIYAKAFDMAGNSLISSVIEIKVYSTDSIIPSIVEFISNGPFTGDINLFANAYDAETGIAIVEYWDGDPSVEGSVFLGSSDISSNAYNVIWITDSGGGDDGIHSIYVRAYDYVGNFNVSSSVDIEVYTRILSEDGETALLVTGAAVAGTVIAPIGSKVLSIAGEWLPSLFKLKKKKKKSNLAKND